MFGTFFSRLIKVYKQHSSRPTTGGYPFLAQGYLPTLSSRLKTIVHKSKQAVPRTHRTKKQKQTELTRSDTWGSHTQESIHAPNVTPLSLHNSLHGNDGHPWRKTGQESSAKLLALTVNQPFPQTKQTQQTTRSHRTTTLLHRGANNAVFSFSTRSYRTIALLHQSPNRGRTTPFSLVAIVGETKTNSPWQWTSRYPSSREWTSSPHQACSAARRTLPAPSFRRVERSTTKKFAPGSKQSQREQRGDIVCMWIPAEYDASGRQMERILYTVIKVKMATNTTIDISYESYTSYQVILAIIQQGLDDVWIVRRNSS